MLEVNIASMNKERTTKREEKIAFTILVAFWFFKEIAERREKLLLALCSTVGATSLTSLIFSYEVRLPLYKRTK